MFKICLNIIYFHIILSLLINQSKNINEIQIFIIIIIIIIIYMNKTLKIKVI
jgi:hypothetical protein